MTRFHIVVINFERIHLFLENFHKLKNFDPDRDRIYVVDSSKEFASEQSALSAFARQNGWRLDDQIHILRRDNWGKTEGAIIDYFRFLRQLKDRPRYIWQFQDHYLDLNSPASRWPKGTLNIDGRHVGGQLKSDTIPDGITIDLNECEQVYKRYPQVSVQYADRLKLGIFSYDEKEWFYADGSNFSVRTDYALKCFTQRLFDCYKEIYDEALYWALFVEFDLGYQLTNDNAEWYDLASHFRFDTPKALRLLEREHNVSLSQQAEKEYIPIYDAYVARLTNCRWSSSPKTGR